MTSISDPYQRPTNAPWTVGNRPLPTPVGSRGARQRETPQISAVSDPTNARRYPLEDRSAFRSVLSPPQTPPARAYTRGRRSQHPAPLTLRGRRKHPRRDPENLYPEGTLPCPAYPSRSAMTERSPSSASEAAEVVPSPAACLSVAAPAPCCATIQRSKQPARCRRPATASSAPVTPSASAPISTIASNTPKSAHVAIRLVLDDRKQLCHGTHRSGRESSSCAGFRPLQLRGLAPLGPRPGLPLQGLGRSAGAARGSLPCKEVADARSRPPLPAVVAGAPAGLVAHAPRLGRGDSAMSGGVALTSISHPRGPGVGRGRPRLRAASLTTETLEAAILAVRQFGDDQSARLRILPTRLLVYPSVSAARWRRAFGPPPLHRLRYRWSLRRRAPAWKRRAASRRVRHAAIALCMPGLELVAGNVAAWGAAFEAGSRG